MKNPRKILEETVDICIDKILSFRKSEEIKGIIDTALAQLEEYYKPIYLKDVPETFMGYKVNELIEVIRFAISKGFDIKSATPLEPIDENTLTRIIYNNLIVEDTSMAKGITSNSHIEVTARNIAHAIAKFGVDKKLEPIDEIRSCFNCKYVAEDCSIFRPTCQYHESWEGSAHFGVSNKLEMLDKDKYTAICTDLADKYFPKGKCNERGALLVFIAILWMELEKFSSTPINLELLEALRNLVERIDINGGIGEYKGGPSFVMKNARQAIANADKFGSPTREKEGK